MPLVFAASNSRAAIAAARSGRDGPLVVVDPRSKNGTRHEGHLQGVCELVVGARLTSTSCCRRSHRRRGSCRSSSTQRCVHRIETWDELDEHIEHLIAIRKAPTLRATEAACRLTPGPLSSPT